MDIAVATRPVRPDDPTLFCRLWDAPLPRDRVPPLPRPAAPAPRRPAARLVTVDHDLREAVVAVVGDDVVGVARYDRSPADPVDRRVRRPRRGRLAGRRRRPPAARRADRAWPPGAACAPSPPPCSRTTTGPRPDPAAAPRLHRSRRTPTSTTSRARSTRQRGIRTGRRSPSSLLSPPPPTETTRGSAMSRLRTTITQPPRGPRPPPRGARARRGRWPWPPPSSPPTRSPASPPVADPARDPGPHRAGRAPLRLRAAWTPGPAATSYEPYVGRWSRRVAAEFVDWLDRPPGARWLDVGCGTGALAEAVLFAAADRGRRRGSLPRLRGTCGRARPRSPGPVRRRRRAGTPRRGRPVRRRRVGADAQLRPRAEPSRCARCAARSARAASSPPTSGTTRTGCS